MEQKKSQMYRVYEMKDEMEKGVNNINKVINQQKELIHILDKNTLILSDDLKNFKKGLEDQLKKYYEQFNNLLKRKDQLAEVIGWYEKSPNKDELDVMLSELFEALFND